MRTTVSTQRHIRRTARRTHPVTPGLLLLAFLVAGCQSAGSADDAEPGGGAATTTGPSPAEVAQSLRGLEMRRLQALVDADLEVLEVLHAEDFRLVPPPGTQLDRDDYLGAVAAGDIDYLLFEPVSEIEVTVDGATAVLTYRSQIHLDAAGQGELEHDAWHTYVYERGSEDWQVVWEQATAVGGFPP
ncbi:nuclear transport factor 2 family protein [Ornithinimicrobium cerasi]|uniref:nuclear transport factor 2 family protein n=1 Tax=Ornithinimicrobium cerasi TaxID=2248773 RepID=UPI0013796705|nr:nuclear transport factor 2 family protein [Ornithinimicrobium cerasi]